MIKIKEKKEKKGRCLNSLPRHIIYSRLKTCTSLSLNLLNRFRNVVRASLL